jgi:hypothetical protein
MPFVGISRTNSDYFCFVELSDWFVGILYEVKKHKILYNIKMKQDVYFDVRVTVHRIYYVSWVTSSVQHTQLTALRYTTQTAYRFEHQKAVLTNVPLKMGILMLETC